FENLLEAIDVASAFILDWTRSPRLQPQLLLIVVLPVVVAMLPLLEGPWMQREVRTGLDPLFAGLWVAGAACALGVAISAKFHRPAALMLSGGAGLCTVITFAWLSAPDLALTQLTVEVVTLVLILLGLRWLPRRVAGEGEVEAPIRSAIFAAVRRSRDFIVAILAGMGFSVIAYAIMTRPHPEGVSYFFVEKSIPLGGGANVVNVILVDFRGFDTLGEITVLG